MRSEWNPFLEQVYYLLKTSSSRFWDFDRFNFTEAVKQSFSDTTKKENYDAINFDFRAVPPSAKKWIYLEGEFAS